MLLLDNCAVSVSIGAAAVIPFEATARAALLEASDKALYATKAGGRNQSRLARLDQFALAA